MPDAIAPHNSSQLTGIHHTEPFRNGPSNEEKISGGGQDAARGDSVQISGQARELFEKFGPRAARESAEVGDSRSSDKKSKQPGELSEDEQKQVEELKKRDREVRAHEMAHMAAAGGFAQGGPSYDYQTGPDGQQYAVGGEVKIDVSPVPNDPGATIAKAQTIKGAALAPAEPSGADRAVAAAAAKMEAEARQQISRERTESIGEVPTDATKARPTREADRTGLSHPEVGRISDTEPRLRSTPPGARLDHRA